MLQAIKERIYRMSIRKKILYPQLLVCILALIVAGMMGFRVTNRQLRQSFSESSSALLEQLNNNILNQIQSFNNQTVSQYLTTDLSLYLPRDPRTDTQGQVSARIKSIKHYTYTIFSYCNFVDTIVLQDMNGLRYINLRDQPENVEVQQCEKKNTPTLDAIFDARGKLYWSCSGGEIFASRVLYDKETLREIGLVSFGLSENFFLNIYQQAEQDSVNRIVLLDQIGNLIFSWDQTTAQLAEEILDQRDIRNTPFLPATLNGQKYLYSVQRIPKTNLYSMNIVQNSQISIHASKLLLPLLTAVLISFALISLVSRAVASNVSRHVNNLVDGMEKVAQGDFSGQVAVEHQDELGMLAQHFNEMSARIQELLNKIVNERVKSSQAEVKALQFEYEALQEKVNPHFLYNVLDSISSMAKLRGEEEIVNAVHLLSSYFREKVNTGTRFVELQQEQANIETYLQLQQIIYADRIQYQLDMDESLETALVPKLVLQPIVENAVLHGILPQPAGGTIRVIAGCEGRDLVIRISDDGVGFSPQQLQQLQEGTLPQQNETHFHVGIMTVEKRLRLLYGKHYGIQAWNNQKAGATVELRLPIQFEEDFLCTR